MIRRPLVFPHNYVELRRASRGRRGRRRRASSRGDGSGEQQWRRAQRRGLRRPPRSTTTVTARRSSRGALQSSLSPPKSTASAAKKHLADDEFLNAMGCTTWTFEDDAAGAARDHAHLRRRRGRRRCHVNPPARPEPRARPCRIILGEAARRAASSRACDEVPASRHPRGARARRAPASVDRAGGASRRRPHARPSAARIGALGVCDERHRGVGVRWSPRAAARPGTSCRGRHPSHRACAAGGTRRLDVARSPRARARAARAASRPSAAGATGASRAPRRAAAAVRLLPARRGGDQLVLRALLVETESRTTRSSFTFFLEKTGWGRGACPDRAAAAAAHEPSPAQPPRPRRGRARVGGRHRVRRPRSTLTRLVFPLGTASVTGRLARARAVDSARASTTLLSAAAWTARQRCAGLGGAPAAARRDACLKRRSRRLAAVCGRECARGVARARSRRARGASMSARARVERRARRGRRRAARATTRCRGARARRRGRPAPSRAGHEFVRDGAHGSERAQRRSRRWSRRRGGASVTRRRGACPRRRCPRRGGARARGGGARAASVDGAAARARDAAGAETMMLVDDVIARAKSRAPRLRPRFARRYFA